MTREIKLALILGSALVLVVGVLVSDHLSAARRTAIAQTTDGRLIGGAPVRPVSQAADSNSQWQTIVANLPANKVEEAPKPAPTATPANPAAQPQQLVMGRDPDAALVAEAKRQGVEIESLSLTDRVSTGLGGEVETKTLAAADREHVVREGDTLWSLAQRYFGDGRKHIAIAEANRETMAAHRGALDIGMKLRIPGAPAGSPGAPGSENALAGATAKDGRPAKYVVKPGDTLVAIARKTLGSERRYEEILALNGISDPDALSVGAELRIPQR